MRKAEIIGGKVRGNEENMGKSRMGDEGRGNMRNEGRGSSESEGWGSWGNYEK